MSTATPGRVLRGFVFAGALALSVALLYAGRTRVVTLNDGAAGAEPSIWTYPLLAILGVGLCEYAWRAVRD